MVRRLLTSVALAGATLLAGCQTPFGGPIGQIDYNVKQHAGPIQFTDPRLFRREALITERTREVSFIETLLTRSETENFAFAPEIVRDLETISTFAANLGLRFDPAAGLNAARTEETSEIQQQIALLRLEIELDQLRRNAELLRSGLPAQTTVSDPNLGTQASTTVTPVPSSVGEVSTQQLLTAITGMQTALAGRLDATRTALSPSAGRASPIDTFYDLNAYRSLLHSARNAASLDELHDHNGSALIRLSFSATVLPPPPRYSSALGVLRMEVSGPEWTHEEEQSVYRLWLLHMNRRLNTVVEPGAFPRFAPDTSLQGLLGGEFFDTAYYGYPIRSGATCPGLATEATPGADCGRLVLAVPRPSTIRGDGPASSLPEFMEMTDAGAEVFADSIGSAQRLLADGRVKITCDSEGGGYEAAVLARSSAQTGDPDAAAVLAPTDRIQLDFERTIITARRLAFVRRAASEADMQARRLIQAAGGPQLPASSSMQGLETLAIRSADLLGQLALAAQNAPGCGDLVSSPASYVPPRFRAALRRESDDHSVRIYDMGPREQTQRVSTAARAANAINIAAAIAAQAPGSDVSANAGLGYARNATGRVEALERTPLAVSFAEPHSAGTRNNAAFGWLLGPRATVSRDSIVLQQQIRPYDLSVDMTVPGWWPYLTLSSQTAWAPNWRGTDEASRGRTVATGALERQVRVPLSINTADLNAFTNLLTDNSLVRIAAITSVRPRRIAGCAATSELQIRGENIWRATAVIIGGRRFSGSAISIMPDLGGIIVTIARGDFPSLEAGSPEKAIVTVLTRYGPAEGEIGIDGLPCPQQSGAVGGGRAGGAPATQLTLGSVTPDTISLCHSRPTFQVTGANLNTAQSVRLGPIVGRLEAAANGNAATVTFPELVTREVFTGIQSTQLIVRAAESSAGVSQPVTILQVRCS